MLPKLVNITDIPVNPEQENVDIKSSFLFDFAKGDFVLVNGKLVKASELESLKVWIQKTLRTELYRFKVYEGKEYGVRLEDLIGQNLPVPFIQSEIQREITDSLLKHEAIESLSNFEVSKDNTVMMVKFTVNLVGETSFEQEVTYSV